MKRILSLIILTSLILASHTFAYTTEQLDAANALASRGIINEHSSDPAAYNLNQNVLRQEIAAISRGVAGVSKAGTCKNIFKDLTSSTPNTWACVNVEPLVENDLIAKNEYFRPEDFITKAETLGMLIKSIGFDYSYDSTNSKGWQEQIVDFAVANGIVDRFTDYDTLATRGWVFEVANYSLVKREKEIEEGTWKGRKMYSDEASIQNDFGFNVNEIFNMAN